MSAMSLDTVPTGLLGRFRGLVVSTRLPHSSRRYLEVKDAEGGTWRLVSWSTASSRLVLAYGPRGRWLLGRADDPDYWVGWAEPLVRI